MSVSPSGQPVNHNSAKSLDDWRSAFEARGARVKEDQDGRGFMVRCPMPDHPDKHASLHVGRGHTQAVVTKCFGCDASFDQIREVLFPNSKMQRQEPMKTYDYRDEDNILLYQVCRTAGKEFPQRRPDNQGGWIWNMNGVRRVLYKLPELMRSDKNVYIFVVEGEKDVNRLASLGKTATTNPGGAGKWRPEYNKFLKDHHVVLIPDHDKQGREHMANVARQLHGTAKAVRILNLPDLRDKGDVSDWLNDGHDIDELSKLVDKAPAYTPTGEMKNKINQETNDLNSVSYVEDEHGITWLKHTKEGVVPTPLTNFTAKIVSNVVRDDGVETNHTFEIEAILKRQKKRFTVSASRFNGMSWPIENLGASALLYPGFTVRDHARCAIQMLSDEIHSRVVYTYIGWRKINDEWYYLNGNGAIGPKGSVDTVETDLPDNLKHYKLPDPPDEKNLRESVRACLRFLDLVPRVVTWPLFCLPWRAVLGNCHFTVHLVGHTGEGKTELAALVQQCFGASMVATNLPGSWSSTANALEGLAFSAKDAVLVVDDFAPGGSLFDIQKINREAERFLRAQGNQSSRQRMRSDATLRPAKPPRCLVLSTGEDVPHSQSIRARMLILEVGQGEMDWEKLTGCQNDAREGCYAQTMAGFIRWLAPKMETIFQQRDRRIASFRPSIQEAHHHKRIPDTLGNLLFGFEIFETFAREIGAINQDEEFDLWKCCYSTLKEVAQSQGSYQVSCDPAIRFLELLSSAISSGRAHVANANGSKPDKPQAWGWRLKTVGTGVNEREEWQSSGDRVGWVKDGDLFLDPDASYKAAQAMGSGGDGISVTPNTLLKRLNEKGLLLSKESQRNRLTIRYTLEGSRKKVIHFAKESLVPQKPSQPSQVSHEPNNEAKNRDCGTVLGDSFGPHPDKTVPESGPENAPVATKIADDGTNGTNGTLGTVSVIEKDAEIQG